MNITKSNISRASGMFNGLANKQTAKYFTGTLILNDI